MPNSTRRRVGHRAASPANMHENTRSRTATAPGGTPSLARGGGGGGAAALVRQAGGDTAGAALTSSPPRNPGSESDGGSAARAAFDGILRTRGGAVPGLVGGATDHRELANATRPRLVFLGATQPAALLAHALVTRVDFMQYCLLYTSPSPRDRG